MAILTTKKMIDFLGNLPIRYRVSYQYCGFSWTLRK